MKVLVIGLGYVGKVVALQLARKGHSVTGVRRSNAADPELQQAGVALLQADISASWEDSALYQGKPDFEWVVNCAAPAGSAEQSYEELYLNGTRQLVRWLGSNARLLKYVYTSSTGVYGQDDGSEVTENDPATPESQTGKVLVATEQVLLQAAAAKGFPAVILRVAGIYGPGRGYWLRQFMEGSAALEGEGSRVLNMVHRDDVAGAIEAALRKAAPGEIFNVVDCEPSTQLEVFRWLAQYTARPTPQPGSSTMQRSRKVTNKRISNRKLVETLGYQFVYRDFKEGFASLLPSSPK